jgi:hypothetical protein
MPGGKLPIVAGKIGGMHSNEESEVFMYDYIPAIEKKICHPIRIAVLSDSRESVIFIVHPISEREKFPDMVRRITCEI